MSYGFWCVANLLIAIFGGILIVAASIFVLYDFLDTLIEPDERWAHLAAAVICVAVAGLLGWSLLLGRRALGRRLGWLGTEP